MITNFVLVQFSSLFQKVAVIFKESYLTIIRYLQVYLDLIKRITDSLQVFINEYLRRVLDMQMKTFGKTDPSQLDQQ